MRKIEKEMLNAVHTKMDKWVKDNTAVFYLADNETGNPYGARSEIYLHGNLIAEYWHSKGISVDITTLKRWSTPTTKSRLRALGAKVSTKKGITYLNGEAL